MFKKVRNLLNIPLSIYHYKRKSLTLPYLPNTLWIEPTNACNLKCIMCPNSVRKQEKYGFMDMKLYKQIIDKAKDFVSYITLCISGEPLLHSNLPEMIRYAKANGIRTYLSTNATLLTPTLSKRLLLNGLDWISFSFDGCTKETYERIRAGADFDKTLDNLITFLNLKKQFNAKIRAEIQVLVMNVRDSLNDIITFKNRFKDLPLDRIQFRQPSTWGKVFLNTKEFNPKKLDNKFSPCSYLWSSLCILWDGRIIACPSDFFGDNVLGRFPDKTLKEIWNDTPMRVFRSAMVNRNYLSFNPNCEGCDSLWEQRICGLPAGLRGISAMTAVNVFGRWLTKLLWQLKPY